MFDCRTRSYRGHAWVCLLLLVAWVGSTGTPATARPAEAPAFPRLAGTLSPEQYNAEALVIVHYRRVDGQYADWNLWAWPEGGEGRAAEFAGETAFGRYAVVPLPERVNRAGIIVRKGNWLQKDVDQDRFVEFAPRGVAEVWLVSGDPTVYAAPDGIDFTVRWVGAFLDASDRITLATTGPLDAAQLAGLRVWDREKNALAVAAVEADDRPGSTRMLYAVRLREPVAPERVAHLSIDIPAIGGGTVYARDVLNEPAFVASDADLGYRYASAGTTFQTWSPVADTVELLLYDRLGSVEPRDVIELRRGGGGLWRADVQGDLHGTPYRYRFTSYGKARTVPDIHTYAANADSSMSVVVDLDRLAPEGWGTVDPPKLAQPTDEVIYEVHVRDYTVADDACPPALRGTYLGMVHSNPAGQGRVSTGIDHLKDLGVTAVHLLPIHDFSAAVGEYNWGYWTALFNVPEGNYSTDPQDPTRAIVELRQAVQAMHRAGLRVILDVVYNHTSSSGEHSPFEQTVPYFYFRTTPDGRLRNDAGVGNSIADERPMVRKYIVDSASFWVRQYRVDGFRFDLLGTHQPETVRALLAALLPLRSDLTLYGEPWTGGGPVYFGKGSQRGTRMAVFNDHFRNALRGDLDGTATGFATGPGGDAPAVMRGVAGAIDDFADHPIETINYVSAHDNLTLWDKLRHAHPDADDATLRAMSRLATGIVLTSQGIAFVHGGCDFGRTKGGNSNSYNAGDAVNRFDWARKAEYADLFEYTRGLIALRRAQPAFRLPEAWDVRKHLRFVQTGPEVVAYTLDGSGLPGSWTKIFVAYNGEPTPQRLDLPSGRWDVVVDERSAGTETLRTVEGTFELAPYSMFVARRPE